MSDQACPACGSDTAQHRTGSANCLQRQLDDLRTRLRGAAKEHDELTAALRGLEQAAATHANEYGCSSELGACLSDARALLARVGAPALEQSDA